MPDDDYDNIQEADLIRGSVGSIIMVCPVCGEEHFRDCISQNEHCFKGHGRMEPLTKQNVEKYKIIWRSDAYSTAGREAIND